MRQGAVGARGLPPRWMGPQQHSSGPWPCMAHLQDSCISVHLVGGQAYLGLLGRKHNDCSNDTGQHTQQEGLGGARKNTGQHTQEKACTNAQLRGDQNPPWCDGIYRHWDQTMGAQCKH